MAAARLRGVTVEADKRPPHAFKIVKPGCARDLLERLGAVFFDAHRSRFDPQSLDGFRRGKSGLLGENPGELPRTQIGLSGQFINR